LIGIEKVLTSAGYKPTALELHDTMGKSQSKFNCFKQQKKEASVPLEAHPNEDEDIVPPKEAKQTKSGSPVKPLGLKQWTDGVANIVPNNEAVNEGEAAVTEAPKLPIVE
jgi:predicted Zn-dependent protease